MPSICAVEGCVNQVRRKNPEISLFSFPKEEYYIKEWQKVCRNKNINPKYARICSVHFRPDHYREKSYVNLVLNTTPKHTRRLRRDAIPSENLYKKNGHGEEEGAENGISEMSSSASEEYESDGILATLSALISSPVSEGNLEKASEELAKLQKAIAEQLEKLEKEDTEDIEKEESFDTDLNERQNEDSNQMERLREDNEKYRKENKVLREESQQRLQQMFEAKKQEAWWKKACHIYKTRAEYAEAKLNFIASKNEKLMNLFTSEQINK
ncbi:THAP domain-containing protein 1-like [Belonocnema kinseyi]|uniref:THAP domain-containing protein 1-like n=1 Tax=Belonocnema kinseyi TaxID=2817044 RepID=UPI00143CF801|nr:THAP domain-containing protein 1-like [Belonocnema kinseyi]